MKVYALKQQKGEQAETSTEQESMVDLVQLGGPRNRKDFQPPGLCPIVHGTPFLPPFSSSVPLFVSR